MVLSTHAVVGGVAAGVLTSSPPVGLLIGMLTHYLLDAIPHWDYELACTEQRESFSGVTRSDRLKLACDVAIGGAILLLLLATTPIDPLILILGALGGVLPDILQVLHRLFPKNPPLYVLQRLHDLSHAHLRLKTPYIGIALQALVVLGAVITAYVVM